MRRRMRDDDDALRSLASAMLRELRMQEERDGDDDYYRDRRCAPNDTSHSSPPWSLSSLAPHPHRECTIVGVAEFGPVRDREHDRGERARADPDRIGVVGSIEWERLARWAALSGNAGCDWRREQGRVGPLLSMVASGGMGSGTVPEL